MYVSKIPVRECSNDDQLHLFRPALPGRRTMLSFIVADAVLIYLSAVELSLTVSLLYRSNEGQCCRIRARELTLCELEFIGLCVQSSLEDLQYVSAHA